MKAPRTERLVRAARRLCQTAFAREHRLGSTSRVAPRPLSALVFDDTSWVAARYALRVRNTAVMHTSRKRARPNADQDSLIFCITRISAILASAKAWRVCLLRAWKR
jgi:hypothetical protein